MVKLVTTILCWGGGVDLHAVVCIMKTISHQCQNNIAKAEDMALLSSILVTGPPMCAFRTRQTNISHSVY